MVAGGDKGPKRERDMDQPRQELHDVEPDIIYHYTTSKGLIGIFKDHSMRATSALYLNDTTEMNHGLEVVRDVLRDRLVANFVLETVADKLDDACRRSLAERPRYVVSFTTEGDLLSQWRAYAGVSGGYAIGFDFKTISKELRKQGLQFSACRYKADHQKDFAKEAWTDCQQRIDGMMNRLRTTTQTPADNEAAVVFAAIISTLTSNVIPFLKNESFFEEREWRGVLDRARLKNASTVALGFRAKGNELVPYLPVDLGDPLPVKEVIVGPCPRPKESAQSVKLFLEENDLGGVQVQNSKCPYRGWP
jgi:hypothetical protein